MEKMFLALIGIGENGFTLENVWGCIPKAWA